MIEIVVEKMAMRKRGPGGTWHDYVAYRPGEAPRGYGSTEREATNDLKSKEDPSQFKGR